LSVLGGSLDGGGEGWCGPMGMGSCVFGVVREVLGGSRAWSGGSSQILATVEYHSCKGTQGEGACEAKWNNKANKKGYLKDLGTQSSEKSKTRHVEGKDNS